MFPFFYLFNRKGAIEITFRQIVFLILGVILLAIILGITITRLKQGGDIFVNMAKSDNLL